MSIDQLTDKEKECLRLLLYPMRSKEIAIAMGRSVHTVNGHLQEARRKLGVTDSISAAHMLRDAETPQKIEGVNFWVSANPAELAHEDGAEAFGETESARETSRETWGLPFARRERPWNDLDLRWRIAWPVMLFFFAALGVSALSSGAATLSAMHLSVSR
ncbi:DNA-binding transcriptional regulator, CsgD family [Sphingobium sp. AP50]|uniref:helix-turn-helix domain-containing protein n=1 Tax=Sphingobium sp. AP50 TaxID=1884369 RepID=UPI0008D5495D|nr:helix-turn-helix domain-containing protein [Sphingobium sp. AP50]SEK03982.1 DNA-binding transcriptional regulator, CsgD family [Sphingobium sp. AP50]